MKDVDGYIKFDSVEEIVKLAIERQLGLYISRTHRTLSELVLDMEARGIPRNIFPYYFDFALLPTGTAIEIINCNSETNELVVNTLLDEHGICKNTTMKHRF